MSTIYPLDPYPGRCNNYRPGGPYGETRRCLDYEGTQHVCSFDPPKPLQTTTSVSYSLSGVSLPKPWVKPDDTKPNSADGYSAGD